MSRDRRDLASLVQLTALVRDADQARMNALRRHEKGLRDRLAALDADWQDRARRAVVGDIALQSGADHRWQAWIDGRRMTLNQELARVLVDIARVRDDLARSFGRNMATQGLLKQAIRKDEQARARRAGPGS